MERFEIKKIKGDDIVKNPFIRDGQHVLVDNVTHEVLIIQAHLSKDFLQSVRAHIEEANYED